MLKVKMININILLIVYMKRVLKLQLWIAKSLNRGTV